MTAPVVIGAPAKVNLTLHVLGRRADGYHDLESLVAFATIHDVITVAPAEDWSLTVEGPFKDALRAEIGDNQNLVLRAGRILAEHLGRRDGAAIGLHKTIPIAAGLGGGSADAAATLLALCRLWHAELPLPVLAELGLRLGADLPVCLSSRAAYMAGIGERIQVAPEVPPLGIVLVNPGVALPTAMVFRGWQGKTATATRASYRPGDVPSLIAALHNGRNDLMASAIALAPVIGEVMTQIESAPGLLLARLSGSGPTCFGLFADSLAAEKAAASIATARPDWWVRAGRLIRGREELLEG